MVEVVLHIGGEKTGSTSIQIAMKSSRDKLSESGILYPKVFGDSNHVGAYVYASNGDVDELKGQLGVKSKQELGAFRKDTQRELAAEIAATPRLRKIIVSNEHLSARLRTPKELENLRGLFETLLPKVEYRIVYFARPQWELIPSLYSTYVKTGGTDRLIYPMSDTHHYKLQHKRIVDLWQRVFPDAVFEAHSFSTAGDTFDVLGKFAEVCGLAGGEVNEVPDQNVSLSAPAIELMRIFNRYIPRSVDFKFNPSRGNIQQLLEAQEGPSFDIPQSLQGLIATEFAADNAELNERFGREIVAPRQDLIEHMKTCETVEREVKVKLELNEAIRMLSDCFASKQLQFLHVKGRADRLHTQLQDVKQVKPLATGNRAAARQGEGGGRGR